MCNVCLFFFFKQKTAYEMRISDWSSDVCSSDLPNVVVLAIGTLEVFVEVGNAGVQEDIAKQLMLHDDRSRGPDLARSIDLVRRDVVAGYLADDGGQAGRVPGNRSVGRQADEAVECVVGKSIAGDADADLSDQQIGRANV